MESGPDQLRLLELQNLDTRLGQLRAARQNDPSIAAVAELEQRLKKLQNSLVAARTATSDLQREADKVQTRVDEANVHIAKRQAKIDSGELTPKDAMAVTEEMASLVGQIAKLEEQTLEVMERQEACLAAERQVEAAQADLAQALAKAEADRDEALAAIVSEGRGVLSQRDALIPQIDPALLKRYDALRARIGSGAARYSGGKCEGCGLVLTHGDQEAIAKAGPNQVVTCEECGRILVRVPQ